MKRNIISLILALPLLLGAYTASAQVEHNIIKPTEDAEKWEVSHNTAAEGASVNIKYNGNKYVKEVTIKPAYLTLPGVFSVSATKKVKFSKGNLQYNVHDKTWRFADNQWDFVGGTENVEHVGNVSGSTNTNASGPWIDLFGWGTWLEGGNPTNTNQNNSEYQWNACIAIFAEWQTLSYDEWQYLFNAGRYTNTIRADKYGEGKVNGVAGVILLPDNWTYPTISAESTSKDEFVSGESTWENTYTVADWEKMEAAGAVFLPAAGERFGTNVVNVGSGGAYWSSTTELADYAFGGVYFFWGTVCTDNSRRYDGRSVRLVRGL